MWLLSLSSRRLEERTVPPPAGAPVRGVEALRRQEKRKKKREERKEKKEERRGIEWARKRPRGISQRVTRAARLLSRWLPTRLT
jgi:hypothetical protein